MPLFGNLFAHFELQFHFAFEAVPPGTVLGRGFRAGKADSRVAQKEKLIVKITVFSLLAIRGCRERF